MTTYYVGPGGSSGNNGLSWANRKLTLSQVEAIPVVAGDTVYVGPGIYRELLTLGVSGSSGNPITYEADVTGARTDGVGGMVRVTGSDNDQTHTRANCITATSRDWRTFRGFSFDGCSSHFITLITSCSNWVIEDCFFDVNGSGAGTQINVAGTGTANTIRRCVFFPCNTSSITFTNGSAVDNTGHLVENCLGIAPIAALVRSDRIGGITVKNCTGLGGANLVRVGTALTAGQTTTVRDCIAVGQGFCFQAITAPGTNEEITENFNDLYTGGTARSNCTAGANSTTYPALFQPPQLLSGLILPWLFGVLQAGSQLAAKLGSTEATLDLFGRARPATAAKNSWGAIQVQPVTRDMTNFDAGAVGLTLPDASRVQFRVPTPAVSTTISCRVKFDANYAGTKPQMVVKQPGQADVTVTATGTAGSGTYETLTTTLTPSALPTWVVVELVSNNTDTANPATHQAHFDSLAAA